MSYLKIERTEDTPEVVFDGKSGILYMAGISFPDNVERFYLPLTMWLMEYVQNPQPRTEAIFKYDYFNTSSSKKILEIFMILEKIKDLGKEIKVKWMYADEDEDIKSAGVRYSSMTSIPFEIESY
jgi:hypothetical protein